MATHARRVLRLIGFSIQGDLGPITIYQSRKQGLVFFAKSPPLRPPSSGQKQQRNKMVDAAAAWQTLTVPQRHQWRDLAKKARLRITGYQLYMSTKLKPERSHLAAIARQANAPIPPFPNP